MLPLIVHLKDDDRAIQLVPAPDDTQKLAVMTPESHQNRTAGGGQHPQRTIDPARLCPDHRLFQHAQGNGLEFRKGYSRHIRAGTLKPAPVVSEVPPGPLSATCQEQLDRKSVLQGKSVDL